MKWTVRKIWSMYGTKYSRMNQVNLLEDSLSEIWSLQIFYRQSSTNFTWSILENFDSYDTLPLPGMKMSKKVLKLVKALTKKC